VLHVNDPRRRRGCLRLVPVLWTVLHEHIGRWEGKKKKKNRAGSGFSRILNHSAVGDPGLQGGWRGRAVHFLKQPIDLAWRTTGAMLRALWELLGVSVQAGGLTAVDGFRIGCQEEETISTPGAQGREKVVRRKGRPGRIEDLTLKSARFEEFETLMARWKKKKKLRPFLKCAALRFWHGELEYDISILIAGMRNLKLVL